MSETVMSMAANGHNAMAIPLNDLAQAFAYDGNFLETITVVYQGITFIQTFTNDGVDITNISQFVPQA